MLAITKHKYKNSKHYLLVYYDLKQASFDCKSLKQCDFSYYYKPIRSFDDLIEIENFIKSDQFLDFCYNFNIFCSEQLRILVGTDTDNLKYSLNNYYSVIQNKVTNDEQNSYIFCCENMIFIEEFITYKQIQTLNRKIKNYINNRNDTN